MKFEAFSVHDVKAEAYHAPFFQHMLAQGKRTFSDCINSESHPFGKHPHDYTLFHVGEFDDNTGKISPFPSAISLGNGVEYIAVEHQQNLPIFNQDPTGESRSNGESVKAAGTTTEHRP